MRPAPPAADALSRAPAQPRTRAFVDSLQERTFHWFWDLADRTGLTPDRWPTRSFAASQRPVSL
jgi:hypothetical protein